MRALLIIIALAFLGVVIVAPLLLIFGSAFQKGLGVYLAALTEPDALSAIRLTLLVSAIVVPLNTVFGVAAAWLFSKHDLPGKSVLLTLVDLPFSVSPVIAARHLVRDLPDGRAPGAHGHASAGQRRRGGRAHARGERVSDPDTRDPA